MAIQKEARKHAQSNKGRPPKGVHADIVRQQRRILDQEEATGQHAAASLLDGGDAGDKASGSRKRPAEGEAAPRPKSRLKSNSVWPCTPSRISLSLPRIVNGCRLSPRCSALPLILCTSRFVVHGQTFAFVGKHMVHATNLLCCTFGWPV